MNNMECCGLFAKHLLDPSDVSALRGKVVFVCGE